MPFGAPLFYALHYALFGRHPLVPQISLAFLSALQVWLVFDIVARTTKRLDQKRLDKNSPLPLGEGPGVRAGKIAACVLTFWPEHIFYNNLLCTEVPYATLTLLAVWLMRSDRPNSIYRVFLAGSILGAANWVRPTAPLMLIALVFFILLNGPDKLLFRKRIRPALAAIAGFAVLLLPILYLNDRDLGLLSAVASKKSGFNLMYGTNAEHRGFWNVPDTELVEADLARRSCPAGMDVNVYRDRLAREIGIARLKEHPSGVLKLAVCDKIPCLWSYPAFLLWSFDTSSYKDYYEPAAALSFYFHLTAMCLAGFAVLR